VAKTCNLTKFTAFEGTCPSIGDHGSSTRVARGAKGDRPSAPTHRGPREPTSRCAKDI